MHSWAAFVERDNLMDTVSRIAAFERVAGTKEEALAFDYIERTLAAYGAETTRYLHKAFISVPKGASLTVNGQDFFCRTHSHAANTGSLAAPIVEVDKKTMPEAECRGNIVMITGRAEREPLLLAGKRGAVGVVCVAGDVICESCVTPVWGSPDHEELDLMPATPVVSIDAASAAGIRELMTAGKAEAVITASVDHGWRDIPLLVAEIRPDATRTDAFVMFSGHVDSWYYGATDNGTANSVMMEVCRIAAARKNELRRSLRIVFFSGHSQGRYAGSTWYCDSFWEDITENCVASINADVLGGMGAKELMSACMPELRALVGAEVSAATGRTFTAMDYARAADQSFWGTGAPCALASFSKQPPRGDGDTFPKGGNPALGWWWHTPQDTLDKIDPANFERDAKAFASVVHRLAVADILPLRYSAAAQRAIDNLAMWQEKTGDRLDLSLALARARTLKAKLEALEDAARNLDPAKIAVYNATLHAVGRVLVRINYTRGNDFKNDPAAAQPPMPSLRAAALLADADDAMRNALLVALTRGRTYVAYMLKQACAIVDQSGLLPEKTA